MHPSITKHITNHIKATENDLQVFNTVLNEISVSKGQFLLKPGTHVKHEHFVVKGCLRAYYMDNPVRI